MDNLIGTKKMRAAGLLVCGLMLAAIPVLAQQDAPPPPPAGGQQGPGGGRMMNPERQLMMLTRQLSLTPDQQATIKPILLDQKAKMDAQMSSGQPMDRKAMMAAHKEEVAKIEAVLTPEQKTKYEEMEAKRRERMQEQRNGDTPPATPPPPAQ